MNPTDPDSDRVPLTKALAALRDDLAAQPAPPATVLAIARRAVRKGVVPGVERAPAPAYDHALVHEREMRDGQRAGANRSAPAFGAASPSAGEPRTGLLHRRDAWTRLALGPREGWGAWAGAATLAGVLGFSALLAVRPMPPGPDGGANAPGEDGRHLAAASATAEGGLAPAMHFVPLVSPERLRSLAGDVGSPRGGDGRAGGVEATAWVVTTELPQQRLAALGLPYDPGRAADRLRAELLVAASGEVLAVRLLR